MKRILVLLILASLSFAWTNEAVPDMLDARYDYMACGVDYAKVWLEMREDCGEEHNVSVFDSSSYAEDLDEDLADLREANEDADRVDFSLSSVQLGVHSLELLGAVVRDALTNKSFAFFSCVRTDEKPLQDDLSDCRAAAMEKEQDASKDYVNNEIDYANDEIEKLAELGADTSGMEQSVEYAEELIDDIDSAFDGGDYNEVRKLYLRHSRIVLLFRLEQMVATIDYAEPIIEAGHNGNKDEILEQGRDLRDDTEDLIEECEYSDEVNSLLTYGSDNTECWIDGLKLFNDFNGIRLLILEGALG